jgi:hypothetical protein
VSGFAADPGEKGESPGDAVIKGFISPARPARVDEAGHRDVPAASMTTVSPT